MEKTDLLLQECSDEQHEIEHLCQPVRAYITFERVEAYERCEKHLFKYQVLNGKKNPEYETLELFGEPVQMEAAPEPSNVVWENLEVRSSQQRNRKIFAFICIAIFIILTFLLFTVLKSANGKNKLKYPPRTDCENIYNQFGLIPASDPDAE